MKDKDSILSVLALTGVALYYFMHISYERRQIGRFLRRGGAQVMKFRWRPFHGLIGPEWRARHYEVTWREHTGCVLRGMFTCPEGVGVRPPAEPVVIE